MLLNLVFAFNINSLTKKYLEVKTMIRCAEIERLMDLINVQAVTINKIAIHRNISIEADNFFQEVPSLFDYVRLNTIVNVLNGVRIDI